MSCCRGWNGANAFCHWFFDVSTAKRQWTSEDDCTVEDSTLIILNFLTSINCRPFWNFKWNWRRCSVCFITNLAILLADTLSQIIKVSFVTLFKRQCWASKGMLCTQIKDNIISWKCEMSQPGMADISIIKITKYVWVPLTRRIENFRIILKGSSSDLTMYFNLVVVRIHF